MIEAGQNAPDFCLPGIDRSGEEKEFCLKDILKKGRLVLYFYPRDNTPGCTKEACDFRDNLNRLTTKSQVIGVSPDSIANHRKFREKQSLNFPLLSDPEKNVLESYGAFGEKKIYGKLVKGVIRSTYILSEDGTILKKWSPVRVKGHVDQVLKYF
ncbi:MAG: redoxin domain-containing protein [Desulfobulbaceae bacterium]|nr:redoxin domain-containing protein [Desulfobulbaceae bacterium]